ncbi:hypothetical protein BC834DRAFT_971314 [Gloeopeniophorella convolvens]|nr:hypothetical protein BC834DRAFT_971314 [Gloeopeniophorella convolvens]
MATFLSLPDELLIKIMALGGHAAVAACQQTCYRLNGIVNTSAALLYMQALTAAGLLDNTPPAMALIERLKLLEVHETAWENSPWHLAEDHSDLHCLVSSSGNLLLFRIPDQKFLAQVIPSVHRAVPAVSRWKGDMDEYTHELTFDVSRDLLIYLTMNRLHIRELSTSKPHPLSSNGGVFPVHRIDQPHILCNIQVYGELVAYMIASVGGSGSHLCVHNWTTGELISHMGGYRAPLYYDFLDDAHIVSVSSRPGNDPSLVVTNIHSGHRIDFVLDLPSMATNPEFIRGPDAITYYCITVNSMPRPWSHKQPIGYFYSGDAGRIVILDILTHLYGGLRPDSKQRQTFHFSTTALLSHVRSNALATVVPWDEWGPGSFRQVPRLPLAYQTVSGMHAACGMRVIHDHILKDRHGRSVIRIYDYHPQRVRRALAIDGVPVQETPGGRGLWTRLRRSLSHRDAEHAPHVGAGTACVLPGTDGQLPCLAKEIPLPDGPLVTCNLVCVLCEDVVVLLELKQHRYGSPVGRMFYHPI